MGYNGKLHYTSPVAQWPLPSFLFMVRQLAELLGVHPKFLGLLNLGMCKMKSLHQDGWDGVGPRQVIDMTLNSAISAS
jgi:hypothetical protein